MKKTLLLLFLTVGIAAASATTTYTVKLYADGCTEYNTCICPAGQALKISAVPDAHYHFTQWNDGNTQNPRSIVVNSNQTYIANFAIDRHTITTSGVHGTVTGGGSYDYQSQIELTATPDDHYHFSQWSDGVKTNPRTITVTEDKTYTALFAIDQHTVTASGTHGTISGAGTYDYGSDVSLVVTPDIGYHFTQWNDGNTDNPRSITVTQDASFTAEFAIDKQGQCGADLYWQYSDGVLVISGTGAMYDYTHNSVPWMFVFKDSINSLVINNGCTSIGNFAFYGLSNKNLKEIPLPNSVEIIGKYAFAECSYLKNHIRG